MKQQLHFFFQILGTAYFMSSPDEVPLESLRTLE